MEPEGNRARLSIMMFGQYLIMGSWAVTLGTFLMSPPTKGGMNFPPVYTGWIYSTFAFAAIITPLFTGLLADRLFRAEKLLGITNLIGGCLLFAAAGWCVDRQEKIKIAYYNVAAAEFIDGVPVLEKERQFAETSPTRSHSREVDEALQRVNTAPEVRAQVDEAFAPLFGIWFGYAVCLIFSITIGNVVAFRNLRDPKHSYGKVRMLGTIGWIVAGLLLGTCLNPISSAPLFFAAATSLVFGLYCLSLPRTPPSGHSRSVAGAFGVPALSLFRNRSFCVLIFSALFLSAVQQFYVVYANRFLIALGVPSPPAVQTLAQISEVIILLFFAKVLDKLGFKGAMAIGIVVWVIRNGLFATGLPELVVGVALPLHGISYACFFLVASMYVDRKAPLHLRASAQGIFTFVASGAGTLLGNWTSARIVAAQTTGDSVAWTTVWLIPAAVSAVVLLLFLIFFTTVTEQPSAKSAETTTCDPTQ
jgi:nucleoside transporter